LVKTITIREEVYKKLSAIKGKNESFSELFERLTEGRNSLDILMKLRGSVEFKDKKKMLSELYTSRAERRL
jgi:predicted CopG family antitoxin